MAHPTKEERRERKRIGAEWAEISDVIERADVRAQEVNGVEYLGAIAQDAFVLAQEVKNLRLHERKLVNDYNRLLEAMQMRSIEPFVQPTMARIWPKALVH